MAVALVKRGSSLCQTCGYSNGNREFKCKECGCPLPKKAKPIAEIQCEPKLFNNDVYSLLTSGVLPAGSRVFSVRVRSQGPDYRCFVSCVCKRWKCHFSECAVAAEGRSRSGLDATSNTCQHVKEAQKTQCNCEQGVHYQLCSSVLCSGPFPPAVRAEFEAHLINGCTTLIQRVSSKSFVVATSPTSESPLGLLHIRISSGNSFQCTCNKYRRSSTSLASATTAPKLSKRCIHFYLFLWSGLSYESLRKEFSLGENAITETAAAGSDEPTGRENTVESNKCQEEPSSQGEQMQAAKTFEHAPSRVTSTRIIQEVQLIPESPEDPALKEVLRCIQFKDANTILLNQQSSEQCSDAMVWASEYFPGETLCKACNQELSDKMRLPGSRGRTWLISRKGFQEVTVFIKSCRNKYCQARHSFHDWKSGLLNISNKLLVSLELLLEMREHIRRGEPPGNTASAVIVALLDLPSAPVLTPEETRYLTGKLYDGYFAFEVLTKRDWDSAICVICGVCPIFESGDGNAKNCTPLVGEMIQWPSEEEIATLSEEVDIDNWWKFLEGKILEGIAFKDIKEEKVIASCIAPWIPPACRGRVVNTEYLKSNARNHHSPPIPSGCPKTLATLICDGIYDPLNLGGMSITQLREICEMVNIPKALATTKPQMVKHLESLHSYIIQGHSECHIFEAVPSCSGGKVFKNCHHQVILASKFILRKESTRDHTDLLLSSKYWPRVYAVDMACDVVAHVEVRVPKLAKVMWGDRRGCFERPEKTKDPKIKDVPELDPMNQSVVATLSYSAFRQEHMYTRSLEHPITRTFDRYVVGDRFHDGPRTSGHKKDTCKYHNMNLCPQLTTYKSVTSEVINSKIKSTRLQSSNQQNILHYYIYNRLMDYFHNTSIIQKQYRTMQARAQPGETVTRDYLHRFVYTKS